MPTTFACSPRAENRWPWTASRSVCPCRRSSLPPWDVPSKTRPGMPQCGCSWSGRLRCGPVSCSTQTTLPPVVEIVRRLDGLPLAIELAAARLRTLPVGEVARRLERPVPVADPRAPHRPAPTPDATRRRGVELGPAHRRRAPAGRTARGVSGRRDTAQRCGDLQRRPPCAAQDIPAPARHPCRQVAARGRGGSRVLRYRMLETIREFGVDRLAERGEAEAARERHARGSPTSSTSLPSGSTGPGQLHAASRLDAERENILAALRFLGDSGEAATALRLAVELSWYWVILDNDSGRLSMADVRAGRAGGKRPRRSRARRRDVTHRRRDERVAERAGHRRCARPAR